MYGGGSKWIGVNDIDNEGIPINSDGSPLDFTNWRGGDGAPGNGLDCVDMNQNANKQWLYKPCAQAKGFICGKVSCPDSCRKQ